MSTLEKSGGALAEAGLVGFALFAPVSIAATQIALGVVAAGLTLAALGGWRPLRTPLDLGLAAFIGAALCSTLLSREGPGAPASFTLWRHAAGFWLAWQALSLARDAGRAARRALLAAALGLGLASLLGLAQYRSGIDLVHALGLRETARLVAAPGVPGRFAAMGFFVSRLTFGHNAMLLAALLAGAILFGGLTTRARAALGASLLLALAAILLTFDRAAWLGLLAAVSTLACIYLSRALRKPGGSAPAATALAATPTPAEKLRGTPTIGGSRRKLAALALGCVLLGLAAALVPGVRARFTSGFDLGQNRDRVFLWSRALEIIRDHPLAGIGFGNYPRVCPRYYDRLDPAFPMRTWAHNSVLSLWAETGPLGLLALGFLLVQLARALAARLRAGGPFTAGALAAAAALGVVAQFHDVIYDSKVMYPLWLALALGLQPRLGGAERNVQPATPQELSG